QPRDAEVGRAPGRSDHRRVRPEQSLTALVRDAVHEAHEVAARRLESLVPLHDGRSAPAVGAKAEAERLDAIGRALHLGNLLAIPPGAFPDEARPIEALIQIARRVEDFALLVAHPCGVARRVLE